MRGDARRRHASRTSSTVSVPPRASTKQMGPYPRPARRLSAGDEAAARALGVAAVRLELVLEAANADLQESRGFRAIAVHLVERAEDVAALDFAEREPGLEDSGNHRRGRRRAGRRLSGEEVTIGQR